MRGRIILVVLASFVCCLGCQSEKDETIPDRLIGVWKTSTPGYEDNSLELRKDQILFGVGRSEFSVNSIFKVETVRPAGEHTSLITIYYTDEEGKDNATSIYYDETGTGSIRFKNQMRIEWRHVERRPAVKGSFSRRRPTGSWRKGHIFDIALALLGVALTVGATLWRWQESRAEKLAAAVEKGEAGSAQPRVGNRASSEVRAAKEATDWTQAPVAVPAIAVKEQRRSERILMKIPVQVAGVDAHGKSFEERTFTLSINRNGAFISLCNSPRTGDHVIVTNLGTRQSCAFRLCDYGKHPSGEVTAWGIECLEPNSNFWRIRFPENPPEPSPQENITALVVCATCHSREVAELSVAEYRTMRARGSLKRDCLDCGAPTEWKFILVEAHPGASPEETPAVRLPSGEENRREKRIVAKLPIRLRHAEGGRIESTLTENVSKSGVCCAARTEFNVGDVILLKFESGTGPNEDENRARIRWRRPMGENQKTLYGIRFERKEL
jgi:hypothetical protein